MTEHKTLKIEREYTVKKTGKPFTVSIEIDIEDIAQALAARAIHAKGRKSTGYRGAIRCTVKNESV